MNAFTFKKSFFLGVLIVSIILATLFSAKFTFDLTVPSADPVKVKTEYKMETKVENKAAYEGSKVGFSINPSGAVQFGGAKFVSLSGSNISITIYGLPLTLVTNSSTQLVGVTNLGDMKSGDILSGKAQVDQSSGVIMALHVRDESQTSSRIADLEKQIQILLEQLKKLQAEVKNTI